MDFIDFIYFCTTRNTIKLKRIYMKNMYSILLCLKHIDKTELELESKLKLPLESQFSIARCCYGVI